MPEEVRLWKVGSGDRLEELNRRKLDIETRLEGWLARDISILSTELLVVGRQVETEFGGVIDLLCLDRNGDVVIVELKRDRTPRETTAQALDYATWINGLSHEAITAQASRYLSQSGSSLGNAFKARFGLTLPEVLNENHAIIIVCSQLDSSSERIIRYLSGRHGVNINAATFNYFRADQTADEYLARVFVLDPEQSPGGDTRSKRQPNLKPEQLLELAERVGVGALYRSLTEALGNLPRHATRSSLAFDGRFEGSTKAVFSLIPGESSQENGLRFHLYLYRLAELLRKDIAAIETHLPKRREDWKYYPGAEKDLSGVAGFFTTGDEVQSFASLFDKGTA
jgi:hypothetical protein